MGAVWELEEAGGEVVEAVFHDGQGVHGRGCGILEGGGGRGEGEVEGDVGCQTGGGRYVSIWWKLFGVLLLLMLVLVLCGYGGWMCTHADMMAVVVRE